MAVGGRDLHHLSGRAQRFSFNWTPTKSGEQFIEQFWLAAQQQSRPAGERF